VKIVLSNIDINKIIKAVWINKEKLQILQRVQGLQFENSGSYKSGF